MAEEHEKAVKDKESRLAELQGVVDTLNSRINGMTVSTNFAASRFIAEETLLSAAKAQKLFGDHFEIEDGRMVPYDAPRGAAKRSPLVDARGEPLAFDEAIKRIVESDADRDIILKAKSKPGTGQAPTGGKAPQPQPSEPRGVARIALGIAALRNGSGR